MKCQSENSARYSIMILKPRNPKEEIMYYFVMHIFVFKLWWGAKGISEEAVREQTCIGRGLVLGCMVDFLGIHF